ncbi:MAG: alpha/beta hydrolase [Alphaproteobacteria bacterium]|nr:alpha/beta hydrolase [Alphaproteobacteria bacterium]
MPVLEIARRLQGHAAYAALRMPISWVHMAAGPPVIVDGRTLESRTQWFLQLLARSGQQPLGVLGAERARREFDLFMSVMAGPPEPVSEIVDRIVATPGAGVDGRLRVRLYRPENGGPHLPVILFFHGGGFVIGSLEGYDVPCRHISARTGCAVAAVDYRLAPEHKFPAAIEDGAAAFRWLAAEGGGLGIDPTRIVIGGDSAGGTIATVVAQEMRGAAQPPCLQWLIYPATDLGEERPSHMSCGAGFLLTRPDMEWFRDQYISDPGQVFDPRVSPLRAADLSGSPPALIFTAGFDPLRDEGRAYADRLAASGVRTTHREFDSLIHGFVGMGGTLPAAARAMDDMVAMVRRELARLGQ